MSFNLIILLFTVFLFSENNKNPNPIDLKKGINIKPMLKDGLLINEINKPLSTVEIDLIKDKALKYIPEPITNFDIVLIETSFGLLKAKLFNDVAPKHCLNFKKLANSGFYDGTTFHRVIPNFMIQGGDILSRDGNRSNDGTGNPGWTVDAEFNDIKHTRGVLSMARSSNPNSAGSQFFICVSDQSHLDGKYTAFGKVTEKIGIIDHIVNTPTDKKYTIDTGQDSIPDNEDADNWIRLTHPRTRKPMYHKIPDNREKTEYYREMLNKLRSDNPVVPVIIKTIRVVNKDKS